VFLSRLDMSAQAVKVMANTAAMDVLIKFECMIFRS
jgi:hypothetical protein